MSVTTYEGYGTTAVLDTDARTVTLVHGRAAIKSKRKVSPWVIPLDDVTGVEFREKTMFVRGYVRLVRRDRIGWTEHPPQDINCVLTGKNEVRPFFDALNAARADIVKAPAEAPVPPPPPPSVPAGWYPDPSGAPIQRYWDGRGWTEHTAPLA